jgi:glycosyltransferase involved in cell wall biosynthesis
LQHSDIFITDGVGLVLAAKVHGEGMPMPPLEAMSHRILATTCLLGDISELVIDGETGFSVLPENLQSPYDRISELISVKEKRLRFGNSGSQVIENKHNLAVNVNNYL